MQVPKAPSVPPPKRIIFQTLVGDVRLVLHGPGRPTEAEVDQHIAESLAMAGLVRIVLVVTDGPNAEGPDAPQRARMARAGMLRFPTAVVTESTLARRILIAMSWLGAPIRGFAPEDISRAYEFLNIAPPVRARIPAALEAMKAELDGAPPPVRRSTMPPVPTSRPLGR